MIILQKMVNIHSFQQAYITEKETIMALKHLSETRDKHDFFSKLKKSDLINYHPGTYTREDVCMLGRDHGWHIEYCTPDTEYHRKHGDYICRVIDKLSDNQRIVDPIDEDMIATNFTKSWVNKKALKRFK